MARVRRRAYSFAGRQYSTQIGMLLKNDVDRRFKAATTRRVGRSDTGTVTVYSKGATARRCSVNYTRSLKLFIGHVMAVKLQRDPSSRRVAALYATACGAFCMLPMTSRTLYQRIVLGACYQQGVYRATGYSTRVRFKLCEQLSLLRLHKAICYVALSIYERVTIARAPGSRAKITQKYKTTGSAVTTLRLPSGKIKYASPLAIALLGYIRPRRQHTYKNSRAGY